MDKIRVVGGRALEGTVRISGAKNASLPDLCAALLTDQPVTLHNVPEVRDIRTMGRVLAALGAEVEFRVGGVVDVKARTLTSLEAPYDLVKTMRASVLVLGPLVAREGRARVSLPGGCAIGARPINLHLAALEKMGATITVDHGYVEARAERLRGAEIYFDTVTVTGTENVMMAASRAEGETIIRNAACEPEVVDLADLLVNMGAKIQGAGGPVIRVDGVDTLHGADHTVIPDRIETGTFVAACAIAGGEIEIRGCEPLHLKAVLEKLRETGVRIEEGPENLRVRAPRSPEGGERQHPGLSGLPHRHAGPVHGAHDPGHRHEHPDRDHLREPLHARCGAGAHGRPPAGRGPHRHRDRAHAALGGPGHGHRPARLRLPGGGGARGRGRDHRGPRLPPGPRVLPHRRKATRPGSRYRADRMSRGSPGGSARRCLRWYRRHRRDLPWRRTSDPYRIWVSEVMLQQTTVKTAIPYYEAFLERFPTLAALAAADEEAVLAPGRASATTTGRATCSGPHATSPNATRGRFPKTLDAALAVPGVGLYTASAVLSIAHGVALPVVDGNVRRVLSRLFAAARRRSGRRTPPSTTWPTSSSTARPPATGTRRSWSWGPRSARRATPPAPPAPCARPASPWPAGSWTVPEGRARRLPWRSRWRPPWWRRTADCSSSAERRAACSAACGRCPRPPSSRAACVTWWRSCGSATAWRSSRVRSRVRARHAITFRRIRVEGYSARLRHKPPEDQERYRWATPQEVQALPVSSMTRKLVAGLRSPQLPLAL